VEFLEAEFGKCELVEQIWLYGSSFEATLVAVVVPVKDKLLAWAAGHGELQGKSFGEVCSSPQANAHVLAAVTATGEQYKHIRMC
jgi:long-chain acyl-CoA synthetase